GWTTTHGFFIQMGGFTLYEGSKVIGVLSPERLELLLRLKAIRMPSVTEKEIQDRSKGDGLSKSIVVIQTTWFIAQCIARRVQGLTTTEIELVTLAIAILNCIMYFLWWNKPLNVLSTVSVDLLSPEPPTEPLLELPTALYYSPQTSLPQAVINIVRRMRDILSSCAVGPSRTRVNTFYAYDFTPTMQEQLATFTILPCIGTLFGTIHCAGWNFFFPSLAEANIWRLSSTVITAVPIIWSGTAILGIVDEHDHYDCLSSILAATIILPTAALMPVYILARLVLLVEALISLRNLPQAAYAVVEWTLFLPHV
ncbi:hypothetical protein GALMADRAFT_72624, partial [Galerina marginata CBS 339.88]